MMRTTLTIDDDLAAQIEELRRRMGLSMKNAVNILLREGLKQQLEPLQAKRFQTKTHKLGLRPGFDPTKLNQLAALAIEHGYTLYSNDNDFARFEGLRWQNPLHEA